MSGPGDSASLAAGAVVVNYQRAADTAACLASLLEASPPPAAVAVVDNGSADGSIDSIQAEARKLAPGRVALFKGPDPSAPPENWLDPESGPAVAVIANPDNLGFAAGVNAGLRLLLATPLPWLWLVNNDATVAPDSLAALSACAGERGRAGILGSTVVEADDPQTIQCAGGAAYNPISTVFTPALAGRPLAEARTAPEPRLDYIFGASMFIDRRVLEAVGLLNEDFFLFYEEIDLCRRAEEAGYSLAWCRESIVRHAGSASVGRPGRDERRLIRLANYHENLSTLLFTRRHHPGLFPLAASVRFLGKLAAVARRGEWDLVKPLLAAYRDYFRRGSSGGRP